MRASTFILRQIALFAIVSSLLIGTGCSSNLSAGQVADVSPISDAPRAGNVYLVRGWLGVFSTGIDKLGDKVEAAGVRSRVYRENQWRDLADALVQKYTGAKDPEPLVLVGHSYGADDVVLIARELEKHDITVDLIVTLDPTTPPTVPANVKHVVNLYQTNLLDGLPFMRGIPLKAVEGFAGKLENINIRTREDLLDPDLNHFNIEKKEKIHQEAIRRVLAACPPREQWVANRDLGPTPVMASHVQPPVVRSSAQTSAQATSTLRSGGKLTNNRP
jgi:hypothetical protein